MKVHEQHKNKGPKEIKIALVIVSTTRFDEIQRNKETTDKTIPLVKQILEGHPSILLVNSEIVPDDPEQIKWVLAKLLDDRIIDTIIFSGGTGLSPKDYTYEIIRPRLEKEISGFGELFRYLSYKEIGSSSMLSRATAGIIYNKAIFILPGSPSAVKLALEKLIIPELGHIIYIINKKER